MSVTEVQLYKSLREKLGDEEAQELVNFIKSEINNRIMDLKQIFLVKEDKVEIMRAIYVVGLIQFLAIMGSLLAIISFVLKN